MLFFNKLYSKPNVSWNQNSHGFNIFINGEVPVSDLIINYNSEAPKWIAIDINGNNIIDVK